MSLFSKAATFARSPQGKKLMGQAQQFASKPENRAKIAQFRSRFAKRA
jgi:hypothetical protein